jgi:polyisoprenoid-binding protein YceI
MRIGTLGLCALTVAFSSGSPPPASAAATDVVWSSDASLSKVTLTVPYLFVSKINAMIPIESGTIVTSDASSTPLVVDLRFSSAALTTGDPKRDADLAGEKFFDVVRYPTILFASDQIVETNATTFSVKGTLTMHGASRPLLLEGRILPERRDPDGKRRVRYETTGSFRRSDFGMTYARGVVGNDIALDVVIEALSP